MAAKTPSTVVPYSNGNLRGIVATFTDIDDNDTWTSGFKGAISWGVETSVDGAQDCTIDAYDRTDGKFTFGSAANQTGRVWVIGLGY